MCVRCGPGQVCDREYFLPCVRCCFILMVSIAVLREPPACPGPSQELVPQVLPSGARVYGRFPGGAHGSGPPVILLKGPFSSVTFNRVLVSVHSASSPLSAVGCVRAGRPWAFSPLVPGGRGGHADIRWMRLSRKSRGHRASLLCSRASPAPTTAPGEARACTTC